MWTNYGYKIVWMKLFVMVALKYILLCNVKSRKKTDNGIYKTDTVISINSWDNIMQLALKVWKKSIQQKFGVPSEYS